VPARYYVFTRGTQRRAAKAFADGRVYWAARGRDGFGRRHGRMVRGHSAGDPFRWGAPWTQPVTGSWRALQWQGWERTRGPARTLRGMPKIAHRLPRF
jgi:hypothetical protein